MRKLTTLTTAALVASASMASAQEVEVLVDIWRRSCCAECFETGP